MKFADMVAYVLDIIVPPRTTDTLVRTLELDELRAITLRGDKSGSLPYHDPRVRALVWELKYFAHTRAATLAGAILADVLIGIASESLGKPLLISVPMHAARRRERGHNQTEVLCEATLSHIQTFFDYMPRALVRIKATPQQQGLHKHEREHNLTYAMKAQDEVLIKGHVCVVVDDVSTTGATFAEATRALHDAGAKQVICVALAYS
jgi:ComF family protein